MLKKTGIPVELDEKLELYMQKLKTRESNIPETSAQTRDLEVELEQIQGQIRSLEASRTVGRREMMAVVLGEKNLHRMNGY